MKRMFHKTNIIKRSLLTGMAAVTLFTSVVTQTKAVFAETYDDYYFDDEYCDEYNEEYSDELSDEYVSYSDLYDMDEANGVDPKVLAIITKAAGKIPFAGELVGILDPMIKDLLGTSDDSSKTLQEISSKIDNLELKMDENATKQLAAMYKSSRLDQFNRDITTVRNMTADYYEDVATYLSNPNTTEAEKALLIGSMLDTNTSSTTDYLSVVGTLTSFVNGDQINDNPESICMASYNANCASSVLGSEAAMKNAAYIKNVVAILDYAYRFEALVIDSKIILADNLSKMSDEEKKELKKKYEGLTTESRLIAECGIEDKVTIWKRNAGIIDERGEMTGIKRKYYLVLDQDNPNSVVSKYNNMVEKNWNSFIRAKDYSDLKANITMVPIRMAVGKDYDAAHMGIIGYKRATKFYDYDYYKKMVNNGKDKIDSNIKNNGLTPNEIQKLLVHVANEEILSAPGESYARNINIDRLEYLGFQIKEAILYYEKNEIDDYDNAVDPFSARFPIFITSTNVYNKVDIGYAGWGKTETNELTINYLYLNGRSNSYKPIGLRRYVNNNNVVDTCDYTNRQFLWIEKADAEVYSNEESENAYNMYKLDAIDDDIFGALYIDEVDVYEEEEEDAPEEAPVIFYEEAPEYVDPVIFYEEEPKDVPEEDDPVIFYEDEPEDDPVVLYEDEPEDDPVVFYEDEPEYDNPVVLNIDNLN